jgi:lysophospholipase L1-like esterase
MKKFMIGVGIVVLVPVLTEVVALVLLGSQVVRYRKHWQQLPVSGELVYVALGDSAAQGIGASKPELGYVGQLAKRIHQQTGKTVRVVNLSVSGATTQDVVDHQIPQLAAYRPDIVTLDIGANDIARGYDAAAFTASYTRLASQLPPHTIIGNLPYFGGRIRRNAQALEANRIIDRLAREHNLPVADLQTLTHQRHTWRAYAADYFHPNNRGYHNWADAYWPTVQQQL